MIYRPVPYIVEDIVSQVRTALGYDADGLQYDFGTTLEVVNRLVEKTNSSDLYDKKYPLIWMLIKDSLQETVDVQKAIPRIFKDMTIIFCTETLAEYTSKERYENSIEPVLRPLYDSFMYYLKQNNYLIASNYQHNYYENLFWGRDGVYGKEGNIFNDRIDAIIIDNLDLRIKQNC